MEEEPAFDAAIAQLEAMISAMKHKPGRIFKILSSAGIGIALGCLGLIAFVGYGFFSDQLAEDVTMKIVFGAAGILLGLAVGFVTYSTWSSWWRYPRAVRNLGRVDEYESAFNELSKGPKAVELFSQAFELSPHEWDTETEVLWNRGIAHRLAAEGLGRLKNAQATEKLIEILNESSSDAVLKAKAIWALGEIADPRAVAVLIPLLGEATVATDPKAKNESLSVKYHRALKRSLAEVEERTLSDLASDALAKCGAKELADAFRRALDGHPLPLEAWRDSYFPQIIQALLRAMETQPSVPASNAIRALGELGAVETLSVLRSKTGLFSGEPNWKKHACHEAIAKLEAHAALPRTAVSQPITDTLPRGLQQDAIDATNLPRPGMKGAERQ